MKTITKYQAYDGREFFNKDDCMDYEDVSLNIDKIMLKLESNPDTCEFTNGMGYVQHDEKLFLSVRREILEVAKQISPHKWIQQSIDEGVKVDPSWAGRIISECSNNSLNKAWNRISCIDKLFREWGQPYYRLNPEKAEQVQLN